MASTEYVLMLTEEVDLQLTHDLLPLSLSPVPFQELCPCAMTGILVVLEHCHSPCTCLRTWLVLPISRWLIDQCEHRQLITHLKGDFGCVGCIRLQLHTLQMISTSCLPRGAVVSNTIAKLVQSSCSGLQMQGRQTSSNRLCSCMCMLVLISVKAVLSSTLYVGV